MKSLKSHSIGVRISDAVYDWITDKMKDSGATFSHQVSLILESEMAKEQMAKKKK